MKRQDTIKPRRVNLPDFRNVARGKAALRAMIEAAEGKKTFQQAIEEMKRKTEDQNESD